ncbi:amidohydrolase [Membranicola marinus]|uniref:Amidohydrolase n=1 Tax=Membranihabitans marinus TaxID=1227546 RepID=A0A953HX25_9BACT|nr:amidohydrolase family protein [Membranihabitans marinus]MBY5958186.1 amidohydrolase [Membranihabitans marinus]
MLLLLYTGMELISQTYYTTDDYTSVPKYDVHIHINTERPDFVEKAKKDNFRLINVSLEYTKGWEDVHTKYHHGLIQHQNFPETVQMVTAFAVSDWDDPQWEEKVITWLDSCFDQGALGVKVWKNIGMVSRDQAGELIMIDDPKFKPIFQYIQNRNKTLMGHIGEPKNCWLPLDAMTTNNDRNYFQRHPEYHMYLQPEMPSYQDQIDARDHMLEQNPELTFVAAHLASLEWSVDEIAERLDRFPNMSVELAARMGQIFYQTSKDRERVREFFIRYQDRIMYGTDMGDGGNTPRDELHQNMENTWKRDWQYFVTDEKMESELINAPFHGLKLPAAVVDKIYYTNAVRWYGIGE